MKRDIAIGVIGLGYVGLPLAVEKAKAGFKTTGFDIQQNKVDMVNQGINYIGDVVQEDLAGLVKSGMLRATSKRFADCTPEQIVATLAQEGTYIASTSSLYRLLRKRGALAHRSESRKPQAVRESTQLEVTGPNQFWTWDITWLKTPVRGIFLYAYTIIDLFDRSIIGWCIETHESDELSMLLFARVTRDLKVIPVIVHADNGHPMRGMTLAVFLDSLMISRSYSRPRCSNDNAHIESWHKTLKYSVGYCRFHRNIGVMW
nr:DDE-type integrase/transposase/recombinase [uncultured Sphaerochaeta sp.]